MDSQNTTDRFLDGLEVIIKNGLTKEDIFQARRCLLDYLGATLAGAKMLGERGRKLLAMMKNSNEDGCCTVIGFNASSSLHTSAFVNGLSAHTVELDDGVISGIIHPGAPVLSGLLPVLEKYDVDFYHFCLGLVIGYEASVRLANAIQPSHKKMGYHASATCGLIGVTMGVAAMLGFERRQAKDAFACALASAHGTLKVLEDDSELKPFNVATAASDGVVAALMGMAGFRGADDPLEGYAGFLAQFSDEVDNQKLLGSSSGRLSIYDVYVKPYAACRYCHPSIENALKLRNENNFSIADIEHIDIHTYSLAVNKHDHTIVNNISSAKMSIPFATAISFCMGSASVDAYNDDSINDKEVADLMKKIAVYPNDDFSAKFPELSIATMDVLLSDGRKLFARTDQPKGEAAFPLSDQEMMDKFAGLAVFYGMDVPKAHHLANSILFEETIDLKDIISQI